MGGGLGGWVGEGLGGWEVRLVGGGLGWVMGGHIDCLLCPQLGVVFVAELFKNS